LDYSQNNYDFLGWVSPYSCPLNASELFTPLGFIFVIHSNLHEMQILPKRFPDLENSHLYFTAIPKICGVTGIKGDLSVKQSISSFVNPAPVKMV